MTLAHETFHWIKTGARYVKDRHSDGAGPHPNRKYYGITNVTYLAENEPIWAVRNNDTYAYFTQAVANRPEPVYTGCSQTRELSTVASSSMIGP